MARFIKTLQGLHRVLLASSLLLLIVCLGSTHVIARTELNVWQPWGGDRIARFQKVSTHFEEMHPDVKVQWDVSSNTLETDSKFMVAVAAGVPPDLIFVDGTQVAQFAHAGVLQPLDALLERDGLSEDDFFVPAWRQLLYDGHVWALPQETNPMLGFFWNKDIFAETGLVDRAPVTLAELNEFNKRLVKIGSEGNIERFGLVPWYVYGLHNSIFNWGWIFGGRFFDEQSGEFTVNQPPIVRALSWWKEIADQYGYGNLNVNFFNQTAAMAQLIPTLAIYQMGELDTPINYGVTPYQPYPENGVEGVAWDGGWTVAMPKGSRNKELAWEFMKWFCADPHGTKLVYDYVGQLSGYRASETYEIMRSDPEQSVWVRILEMAQFYRPVTIVTGKMMGELERACDTALRGEKTPQQALDDANEILNHKLQEALAE